jgi:carboxymethylenebutenolidase
MFMRLVALALLFCALSRPAAGAETAAAPPEIVRFPSGKLTLGAEKYPYCAAVDAAGGSMSWQAPELRAALKLSVRKSRAPILFFQAENDFDLGPSKELSKEMLEAGKVAELKIYPAYGETHFDGHSFTWLGSSIWFDDVFAFIEKNCPPRKQ